MARAQGSGSATGSRSKPNKKAFNPLKSVRKRMNSAGKLTPSERASFVVEKRNKRVKTGMRTPPPPATRGPAPRPRPSGSSPSTVSRVIGIPGFGGLDQMNKNTKAINKALGGRRALKRAPRPKR